MVTTGALTGYLMEEVVAWLLQKSGYSLIDEPDPDDDAVEGSPGALYVKGRGGRHQADVLGDFAVAPPFSLPLRLLVEVKARGTKTTIRDVRNAVGTITDVNQRWHFLSDHHALRHTYVYALFSTAGFATDAQTYGLAHNLGLVDLSGSDWAEMVSAARFTARELVSVASTYGAARFPVRLTRIIMRTALGTAPEPDTRPDSRIPDEIIGDLLTPLVSVLRSGPRRAALLGFSPSTPSGVMLRTDDLDAFLRVATRHPTHAVRLRRVRAPDTGEQFPAWALEPATDDESYQLQLSVPRELEARMSEDLTRRQQILALKGAFGGYLTVFAELDDGSPFIVTLRLPLARLPG